jgi:hypothetical protein
VTLPTLLLLLPIVGGIAGTLEAHFVGMMDSNLGTVESVFITYGVGGLLIGMVMVLARGGIWESGRRFPGTSCPPPGLFQASRLGVILLGVWLVLR